MDRQFLCLTYKVPSEPSKHRAYIWRQLKELGAIYLQQGMVILPNTNKYLESFKLLYDKAFEYGGTATLSMMTFVFDEDYERTIAMFNEARANEYDELIDTAEKLHREIQWAIEEKLTFSQYEENEEDFFRLEHWIKKIEKRDYYHHLKKDEALEIIQRVKASLDVYHEKISAFENEGDEEL